MAEYENSYINDERNIQALGNYNQINEEKSDILISGRGNKVNHNHVQLLGGGLTSGGDHQTIVGTHNQPLNSDYIFIVGNGKQREKSNAMVLSDNGNLYTAGGYEADGMIISKKHKIVSDIEVVGNTLAVQYTDGTSELKN